MHIERKFNQTKLIVYCIVVSYNKTILSSRKVLKVKKDIFRDQGYRKSFVLVSRYKPGLVGRQILGKISNTSEHEMHNIAKHA